MIFVVFVIVISMYDICLCMCYIFEQAMKEKRCIVFVIPLWPYAAMQYRVQYCTLDARPLLLVACRSCESALANPFPSSPTKWRASQFFARWKGEHEGCEARANPHARLANYDSPLSANWRFAFVLLDG